MTVPRGPSSTCVYQGRIVKGKMGCCALSKSIRHDDGVVQSQCGPRSGSEESRKWKGRARMLMTRCVDHYTSCSNEIALSLIRCRSSLYMVYILIMKVVYLPTPLYSRHQGGCKVSSHRLLLGGLTSAHRAFAKGYPTRSSSPASTPSYLAPVPMAHSLHSGNLHW